MTARRSSLAQHRGDYGVDGPYVPLGLGLAGLATLLGGLLVRHRAPRLGLAGIAYGIWFLISTGWYLYATRRGKFAVWAGILDGLDLRGDERVLDLGCGRGTVLLMAAKLLSRGEAVGVDLWKSVDQSGNTQASAERNAALEGVAERVTLVTADMRRLPFPDATFDAVVSNLALHNIAEATGREEALAEAVRVLAPGGRLRIVDFRLTSNYAQQVERLGMADVTHCRLGWRSWYGGPWTATKLVSAQKPA
jgi:SAM-dependent methyltransferase